MIPTYRTILQVNLAPLWQEDGSGVLLGLLLTIGAVILLVVFWQWWNQVEDEAEDRDVRMTNSVTVFEPEAAKSPPASAARFAMDLVPMAERGVATPPQPAPETAVPASPMGAPAAIDDLAPAAAPEPETAAAAEPKPAGPDDLIRIEGIGPKIAGILQNAGIQTYAALAATEPEKISAILEAAGPRYKLADPTTWPEQATLAATGQWEELQVMQDELSGGRAR